MQNYEILKIREPKLLNLEVGCSRKVMSPVEALSLILSSGTNSVFSRDNVGG